MIDPVDGDVGRWVHYKWDDGWRVEYGVITSFNEGMVFVRFVGDVGSKGCVREDLHWGVMMICSEGI